MPLVLHIIRACLPCALALPISAFGQCFDRPYSDEHLAEQGTNQEIQSASLSMGWWLDKAIVEALGVDPASTQGSSTAVLTLNATPADSVTPITVQGVANCSNNYWARNNSCTFLAPAKGEFNLRQLDHARAEFTHLLRFGTDIAPALIASPLTANSPGSNFYYPIESDRLIGLSTFSVQSNSATCWSEWHDRSRQLDSTRYWNEVLLEAVRLDLARPTVTARNLYHFSDMAYNLYACIHPESGLAPTRDLGLSCPTGLSPQQQDQWFDEALSWASYEFIESRYALAAGEVQDRLPTSENDPGDGRQDKQVSTMLNRALWARGFGRDAENIQAMRAVERAPASSLWYEESVAVPAGGTYDFGLSAPSNRAVAQLGEQAAKSTLAKFANDGAFERAGYIEPKEARRLVNDSIFLDTASDGIRSHMPENFDAYSYPNDFPTPHSTRVDIDHWVPLSVQDAIGQSGFSSDNDQQPLTLYWGTLSQSFSDLTPFAASDKPGVFFDPGESLVRFDTDPDQFILAHLDVISKSALLSPMDWTNATSDFFDQGFIRQNPGAVVIDTSPRAMGNHDLGLNNGTGYAINPATQAPYTENPVRAADFYRALAEFWADGPNSETPPGHWNTIANDVMQSLADQGQGFRWAGQGLEISEDQFAVQTYLTLNGALHDAAIVAWGIKGAYESSRPISAIRQLAYYAENNAAFAQRLIELGNGLFRMQTLTVPVYADGDPYTYAYETGQQSVGTDIVQRLFVWSFDGGNYWKSRYDYHDNRYLADPSFEPLANQLAFRSSAGLGPQNTRVGWVPADQWLPYQPNNFVSPPFPGFVSGHSTFSRAAAEVLAFATGDPYFPGGLGRFPAPELEFSDDGPYAAEQAFEFQWATYCDAADQSGISRIYGGIHAQFDDLPGRIIGANIGHLAIQTVQEHFPGFPFRPS